MSSKRPAKRPAKRPLRFNALPRELRTGVYKHLASQNKRIALDPTNIKRPGAFVDTKGDAQILNYFLVSRSFYREFVPVFFGNNVFCLLKPIEDHDSLTKIGSGALSSVRHLEVRVKDGGLSDLGPIWETVQSACLSLNEITLVFYHDKYQWLRCLSDLALMPVKPRLCLTLFSSVWSEPRSHSYYRDSMHSSLEAAERRRIFVQFKPFPAKIKTINITASADDTAAYGFLTAKRNGNPVFTPHLDVEQEGCSRLRWIGN